jgi:hypothetical protein
MNSLPQTQKTLSERMRSNAGAHITNSDLNMLCQEIEALSGDYTTTFVNLSAQGTTSATTAITRYGVNVFTTVNSTNYAAILPQPITGKTVKIVNRGTTTLALYPSNPGGQINMSSVNAPAQIPPDGKLYEFICIENPLPGAWTWNPPATAQYDSGDVTSNITLGSNAVISAIDTTTKIENLGFYGTTGWAFNGKNQPPIFFGGTSPTAAAAFKPAIGWNAISKVKVYTNMSATNQNVTFGLSSGAGFNYYDPANGNFVTSGPSGGGNYGNPSTPGNAGLYGYCNQAVTGATLAQNQLTTNVGDPGTCFGELTFFGGGTSIGGGIDSRLGDFYNGPIANPFLISYPTIPIVDSWFTGYINFQIQPRVNLTGFKFRFFLEYY